MNLNASPCVRKAVAAILFFLSVSVNKTEAEDHYVDSSAVSSVPPYESWATAASSIQDAVNVATPGSTVWVTNGVYASNEVLIPGMLLPSRLAMTNSISVRSVNGPGVTVIEGHGPVGTSAVRCVFMSAGELIGFTLRNGHTRQSGISNSETCGGGVFSSSGTLSNCVIQSCIAAKAGGGAYNARLEDCTLRDNVARIGGAACSGTLIGCWIEQNQADTGGGAANAVLERCDVIGNTASSEGGGGDECEFSRCRLVQNEAPYGGGAAVSSVFNSEISLNRAQSGGGLYGCEGINCTITGNEASEEDGGACECTLQNSILTGNTAPTHENYCPDSVECQHCCAHPLPPGSGNIDDPPLLSDQSHLAAQSPCIDAGHSGYCTGTDIDGDTWGDPPSIGCDQFTTTSATGRLSVSFAFDGSGISVGYSVPFAGQVEGRATHSVWDFGDGHHLTNELYASHAWSASGTYLVVLTAFNNTHPQGVAVTQSLFVANSATHYVWAGSTNPVAPYTSHQTAATTIQDAIDACTGSGELVLVSNGIYRTGATLTPEGALLCRVVLTNGVTVRSVGGALHTTIEGNGPCGPSAARCAFLAPGTRLEGFTLRGGHVRECDQAEKDQRGGGAYAVGSVLSRCIIRDNSALNSGGGVYGGVVNGSIVRNNRAYEGGGCAAATVCGSAVSGNEADYGGGVAHGSLVHCTVTGNKAHRVGGGVFNCDAENCIITFNHAPAEPNYDAKDSVLSYCCTIPLGDGTGNTTVDPRLASASHLGGDSPCIAAGNPAASEGVDIDGQAWRTPPSIGCDESYSGSATGAVQAAIALDCCNLSAGSVLDLRADISGNINSSVWSTGDGQIVTNQPYLSHVWRNPGRYTVALTAISDDYPAGLTVTTVVDVACVVTHYVDAASSNPMLPYTNWSTAARTIQDAVDVCRVLGEQVVVTNGIYETGSGICPNSLLRGRVVVTNAYVIRSVNGPGVTTIRGEGPLGGTGMRCAYLSSGAVLRGFTVTNGHSFATGSAEDSNGGGVYAVDAKVQSCTIVGCEAGAQGGGLYGGSAVQCRLIGNSADSGGGAARTSLENCLVRNNRSRLDGAGVYDSTVKNSTVVDNVADGVGGGITDSQAFNSIIYFNTARAELNHVRGSLSSCCTIPAGETQRRFSAVTNDPCFVSRPAGDYHLAEYSPCVDVGSAENTTQSEDLDGKPRVIHGALDLGAFEVIPAHMDDDLDGLPDTWEWQNQQSLTGMVAEADGDGDRSSNLHEYWSDTDPNDARSCLEITRINHIGDDGMEVEWQGGTSVTQYIEICRGQIGRHDKWQVVFTNIPTTPVTNKISIPFVEGQTHMFRVRVRR